MLHLPVSQLQVSPGVRVRARLLKSIREKGVLMPILVCCNESGYQILDGRRRVTAALQAGLGEVPAILVENGGPEVTLLAHATRSENPVAELEAIRQLQRQGLSEKEIARLGYSSLTRIRKLARLNRLVPELAEKVENGEIAPGVAFQVAGLSLEEQHQLLVEDEGRTSSHVTAKTVRQARYARKQAVAPALADLVEPVEPVTVEAMFACLSPETLTRILAELPVKPCFEIWRAKIRRLLKESVFEI